MTAIFAALWLTAAVPAAAQTDLSFGPSPDWLAGAQKDQERPEPEPLAQALDLAFGATVWARVKISTAGPVSDLTKLVAGGFYKLELIELVLICAETGRPLQKAVAKRRKGAKLAAIARDYGLDYDRIYESALAVQEVVDREYLPRFPERQRRRGRRPWQEPD